MEYLVVLEKGETSYGAYVPDLPGCVAVGETRREVLKLIHEGIERHIEGLREAGDPGGYYVRRTHGVIWMLTMYPKNVAENIPTHVLKQIRKEVEDG